LIAEITIGESIKAMDIKIMKIILLNLVVA
jgi:hypothetical protein